jgi:hypothetical protein
LFFLYNLCAYIVKTIYFNEPIQVGTAFPLHGMFLLSQEGLWISALPGAFAFHLLIASLFYYCFYSQKAWSLNRSLREHSAKWKQGDLAPDLLIAAAGLIMLQLATGIGSNTGISQGMIFLAGPACGLTFFFLSNSVRDGDAFERKMLKVFFALSLAVIFLFSLFYDHTENQRIFSRELKPASVSPIRGLRVPSGYSSALEMIVASYNRNECAGKRMIALDYVPLINYVVEHPFDKTVGLVRPLFYFSAEKILAELNKGEQWCVLDITSVETQAAVERDKYDPRATIRKWLESHSSSSEKIDPSGLVDLSAITMFVVK